MSFEELSSEEYVALGVMPMASFDPEHRRRINLAANSEHPPRKWAAFQSAQMTSRAWFEWHLRRTRRDPRKAREKISPSLRREVVARDGMVCGICGGPVARPDLHIDHIVPVARGGRTIASNLQPAHASCNIRKGCS